MLNMKNFILSFIFLMFYLNAYTQTTDSLRLPRTVTAVYSDTPLRDSPDPSSEITSKVPKGSVLEVIGSFESYLWVKLDSMKGFVSYQLVKSYSPEFSKFVSNAKDIELKNKAIELEKKNKERAKSLIIKYGEWAASRILSNKIWIGMTEEMLLDSWGSPNDINRTVTKYTNKSQYVYGLGQYIYVENGKVTAWQN